MQNKKQDIKGSITSLKSTDFEDNNLFEEQDMNLQDQTNKSQGSINYMKDSFHLSYSSYSQGKVQKLVEKQKMCEILISLFCMIIFISVTCFYKEILSYLVIRLNVIEPEQHEKSSKFNQNKNTYKIQSFEASQLGILDQNLLDICPNVDGSFHVDLEDNYKQKKLPIDILNQIDLCSVSILGLKDFQQLKLKWNQRFPQNQIIDENFVTQQKNQTLLILLKLFFSGGTYINITVPYPKIHYRCQKTTLTGFDTIFGAFSQKNQQNNFIPNPNTFVKVRFSFSPFIKQMIDKITKNQDYLEECRQKQCLIVKCID